MKVNRNLFEFCRQAPRSIISIAQLVKFYGNTSLTIADESSMSGTSMSVDLDRIKSVVSVAVSSYLREMSRLRKEYDRVLLLMQSEGLLDFAQTQSYRRSSGKIAGLASTHVFSEESEQRRPIRVDEVSDYPWIVNPDLQNNFSEKLKSKIDRLCEDSRIYHRCTRGFHEAVKGFVGLDDE